MIWREGCRGDMGGRGIILRSTEEAVRGGYYGPSC